MFHNRHLLPTDELATAIMLARVSIRPIERIQALKAKSAFMSSAHCVGFLLQLLLPLRPGIVGDPLGTEPGARASAMISVDASPSPWACAPSSSVSCVVLRSSIVLCVRGVRLQDDDRTDGDECVARALLCMGAGSGASLVSVFVVLSPARGDAGLTVVH